MRTTEAHPLAATVIVAATLLAGCMPTVPRQGGAVTEELTKQAHVERMSKAQLEPTDPDALELHFRDGFYLTEDGARSSERSKDLLKAARREKTVLAEVRVYRMEPDHEGAVRELRVAAAELGADLLLRVYYVLRIGENLKTSTRINGWVYYGTAATRPSETEVRR